VEIEIKPRKIPQMTPMRIAIVGSTGSGKTALARRLSALLELPHVELNALCRSVLPISVPTFPGILSSCVRTTTSCSIVVR